MKKVLVIASLVLLTIALGTYFYYPRGKGSRDFEASGNIEATEVEVSGKISGHLQELRVKEGDWVKKDAVIAVLEAREINAELARMGARYAQTLASDGIARDNLERVEKLFADRIATDQQLAQAENQYRATQAAISEARAGVRYVRTQLDNAVIRAPISGRVILKSVEQGELVSLGMSLVTLADLKTVFLTVYVPEREAGRISLGQPAGVKVDSYPGEVFTGKVVYISSSAEFTPKNIQTKDERVSQVYGVKLEIPNPAEKLKIGMPADAELIF